MKEFIEKLIDRLEEQQAEAENEMHRLRSEDYVLPCSYDITDIKEIASESFKESIEIVNELAEEYNNGFCEWKLDGVYLLCQHNTELVISCLEEEKYRYTYCPYCGKKIKVVEE